MSTPTPDIPQIAQKADPQGMTLRSPPRPVVRLNRRTLVVLAGMIAALVLGATLWSLQPVRRTSGPSAELFNVDRVPRTDTLDQLPKDYSKLAVPSKPVIPVLGEPLPGDLGPAMVHAERQRQANAAATYNDPAQADRLTRLKDAEEAARSAVFFRSGGARQDKTMTAAAAGSLVPGSARAC